VVQRISRKRVNWFPRTDGVCRKRLIASNLLSSYYMFSSFIYANQRYLTCVLLSRRDRRLDVINIRLNLFSPFTLLIIGSRSILQPTLSGKVVICLIGGRYVIAFTPVHSALQCKSNNSDAWLPIHFSEREAFKRCRVNQFMVSIVIASLAVQTKLYG
jgi:hypothetical protein